MKPYALLLILSLMAMAAAGQAGEIDRIRQAGVITVSLNRGYPPFAIPKADTIIGLDVDLAHLLADYLGVKLRFIMPETYDQQIPKLLAGESDIIMAAMTRTVERALKVNFSKPYFEVSQAAMARREKLPAGATAYFDLLVVGGLRLGVKTGTTHESFARQLFPAEAIRTYPTTEAAAEAMLRGEVDAMVADSPFVETWRHTHVNHYATITALLAPVTREFYAFAIRRGDPDFLNWINLFVDQIHADGTLDLLRYEYFQQPAWIGEEAQQRKRLTRAEFLKNRFVADKRAKIEKRRQAYKGKGDNYE